MNSDTLNDILIGHVNTPFVLTYMPKSTYLSPHIPYNIQISKFVSRINKLCMQK